jgi:hypothetical protein
MLTNANKFGLGVGVTIGACVMVVLTLLQEHNPIASNKALAVASLKRIHEMETQYAEAHPSVGFACGLEKLQGSLMKEEERERMTATLKGESHGYRFQLARCLAESDGVVRKYDVVAVPLKAYATGVRAFCVNQTGNVRADVQGSADGCVTNGELVWPEDPSPQ